MFKKSFIFILVLLAFSSYSFAQRKDTISKIEIPEKSWALKVSLPDWVVTETMFSLDGQYGSLDAAIKSEGYLLTIKWAKTPETVTGKALRDLASNILKQSPVEKDGFALSGYKDFPMLEYLIKEFRGIRIDQKYYDAYIAKDGVRIEIHLSKAKFKTGDEKRFFAILDSIKFVDAKPSKKIRLVSR